MTLSLKKHIEKINLRSSNRIGVYPDITKLASKSALIGVEHLCPEEDILIIIDDTILKSWKDGIVVTKEYIVLREAFNNPIPIPFKDIESIAFDGKGVFINGKCMLKLSMPDKRTVHDIINHISEWLKNEFDPLEMPSIDHEALPTSRHKLDISASIHEWLDTERESLIRNSNRVYISPNIPQKKLINAISSFGPGASKEDVLILCDDTLFGSSKEGLLVLKTRICIKFLFEQPKLYAYQDIESINLKNRKLYLNNEFIGEFSQLDNNEIGKLINFLNVPIRKIDNHSEPGLINDPRTQANDDDSTNELSDEIFTRLIKSFDDNNELISTAFRSKINVIEALSERGDMGHWLSDFLYEYIPKPIQKILKKNLFERFCNEYGDEILRKLLTDANRFNVTNQPNRYPEYIYYTRKVVYASRRAFENENLTDQEKNLLFSNFINHIDMICDLDVLAQINERMDFTLTKIKGPTNTSEISIAKALLTFTLLYSRSITLLPIEFKNALGNAYYDILGMSKVFTDSVLDQVANTHNVTNIIDDEIFGFITIVFHADMNSRKNRDLIEGILQNAGASNKEEFLLCMLDEFDLPRSISEKMIKKSTSIVNNWLNELQNHFNRLN